MLHALMKQPIQFQKRVVIGSIESHLHFKDIALLPNGWSADGLIAPHLQSAFRLISLPYPTSVTSARNLLNLTGSGGVSGNESDQRPIRVLFSGSLTRGNSSNNGRLGQTNRVRGLMSRALRRFGALHGSLVCAKDGCAVCTVGLEKECKAMVLHQFKDRLWELAASAVFCLEPPGDTLTRSHFFVAVSSGCIPVIFDGGDGSNLYSPHEPTHWPWRLVGPTKRVHHDHRRTKRGQYAHHDHHSTPAHHDHNSHRSSGDKFRSTLTRVGLDYSKFTVAVNVTEVLEHVPNPRLGSDGFLGRLIEMPQEKVERLQQGLVEAAPAMVYSPASTLAVPAKDDAFARFFNLLVTPGIMHGLNARKSNNPTPSN
mmetsp:Transcript_13169/g.22286  ORF Transcript_13169/g.22286 Transcript_13169/m.22286 type:complete len:369 (+) Transcript_13169:129-1235(+)